MKKGGAKIKSYSGPKKSLGQNFLTSVGAINKIVSSADYAAGLTILEVGPGRGVLTEALLKKFDRVLAVEKDERLVEQLKEKFAKEINSGQLRIVVGDILELNPADLGLKNYSIVANIPYYITGQFLRIWLSPRHGGASQQPKYMVLLVQKEVAKRIVAADGKESLLSISVKAYGEPSYIETVKRGSFFPVPNVDSAILKIDKISNLDTECLSEGGRFFALVKAGFAHKRKLLLSNLKKSLFPERFNLSQIKGIFALCQIDPKARAEDLTVGDWRCLTKETLIP